MAEVRIEITGVRRRFWRDGWSEDRLQGYVWEVWLQYPFRMHRTVVQYE